MPSVFDGLIDIQHVPDSSLITQAQTSGKGFNKGKQRQTLLQFIHEGKPCVLVMVITICGKHNGAKFISRQTFQAAHQIDYQIKGTLRIMDVWIITAALLLCCCISGGSLLCSRLILNWEWIELASRWLFMAGLHPRVSLQYKPI